MSCARRQDDAWIMNTRCLLKLNRPVSGESYMCRVQSVMERTDDCLHLRGANPPYCQRDRPAQQMRPRAVAPHGAADPKIIPNGTKATRIAKRGPNNTSIDR